MALCFGCHVSEFDSAEGLTWYISCPENGLTKTSESNGIKVTVSCQPTDLLVFHEAGDSPIDTTVANSLRKKYSNYYYFVMSFSRNNEEVLHKLAGGMEQYSWLVQTLSFRMGDHVRLITSTGDTIRVSDFMLDRTYGLNKSTSVLFVFNKEKANGRDWIQFNLDEFGLGIGNQHFRFYKQQIDEAPQIDFSKI